MKTRQWAQFVAVGVGSEEKGIGDKYNREFSVRQRRYYREVFFRLTSVSGKFRVQILVSLS
jgi:hypothetical protein